MSVCVCTVFETVCLCLVCLSVSFCLGVLECVYQYPSTAVLVVVVDVVICLFLKVMMSYLEEIDDDDGVSSPITPRVLWKNQR